MSRHNRTKILNIALPFDAGSTRRRTDRLINQSGNYRADSTGKNAANSPFPSFMRTDIGRHFVLSQKTSGKIGAAVGNPCCNKHDETIEHTMLRMNHLHISNGAKRERGYKSGEKHGCDLGNHYPFGIRNHHNELRDYIDKGDRHNVVAQSLHHKKRNQSGKCEIYYGKRDVFQKPISMQNLIGCHHTDDTDNDIKDRRIVKKQGGKQDYN